MSAFGGGSFLDTLLLGIKRVWRNGFALPQRPVINFINFPLVVDNPSLGTTDVYGSSTGGSTGAALAIVENNGVAMPFEPAINFVGFVLADDPGNSRTNIAPPALGVTDVPHGGTQRSSLTTHAVLLGEGTAAVGFAAPTSSGFVLTDNGPGADPTFQAAPTGLPGGTGIVAVTGGVGSTLAIPLPVADGGTGVTTAASNAVLLGHATSPFQFASPTSSGFVLTDNGPGVNPSFAPLPASGGLTNPGSTITGAIILGAGVTWANFTGGTYAIDLKNLPPLVPLRLTYVSTSSTPILLELTNVTIVDSSHAFLLEHPSDRSQPTSSLQQLDVSWRTYELAKDPARGVIACIGFA